ncbi:hypothetical protein [Kribbella catacumbae]|uniref:hypothetical protein n=1 Tax=Kribbella catacumbae TaxID=460086 RepID=UPI000366A8EE|nr:hypothetical protein [Kribbella catacumbae]
MTTATIPGVELVKVGRWGASTGVTDVTREDLDSIVAAYADQQIDRPAIKIGHTDQRFNDGDQAPRAGDGEPAYGWVENVRLNATGDGILGDLTGIPSKLAEVIPAAFRRRSVEIAWGLKTTAGKTYRAALTGLALLGIAKPAVKGMADVLALYAEGDRPREGVTAVEQVDGVDAAGLVMLAAARAEVAKFAADHQVPEATLTGALDRLDRLSGMRDTATVPPAPSEPSDGSTSGAPAPTTTPKEEPRMALTEERVRELLKLEKDADVEKAIADLITGSITEPPKEDEVPKDAPVVDEPPKDAPVASEGAPATVTLSAGQLAALQAQAKAGDDAAKELARQRRDGIVKTALSEGRITVDESKTWRTQLDTNEAGTVSLLSSLAAGRVPTTEIGSDADVSAFGAGDGPSQEAWAEAAKDMFDVDLTGGN